MKKNKNHLKSLIALVLTLSLALGTVPTVFASTKKPFTDEFVTASDIIQDERRQAYEEILIENAPASQMIARFKEEFGDNMSPEYIRKNYKDIFQVDEIDEGFLDIIAPLEGNESLNPHIHIETIPEPELAEMAPLALAPDVVFINEELVEFDFSVTDDVRRTENIDIFYDDNIPVITGDELRFDMNTKLSKTSASPKSLPASASSSGFTSISLVQKTATSIVVDIWYKNNSDGNNIFRMYDPVTNSWPYLLGRDGKPPATSQRYTINNLKPGATYKLLVTTYDFPSASWKDSEITVQTTPNPTLFEIQEVGQTSIKVNVSYPCDYVWGRWLIYYDALTKVWIPVGTEYYTPSGVHTISGLLSGQSYTIKYGVYDSITSTWDITTETVTTLAPPESWVSSQTENLTFSFEPSDVALFAGSNYSTWKNRMQTVYDDMYEFTNKSSDYGEEIEIKSTRTEIPNSWGMSGNPILINRNWVPDMINRINTENDWAFGVIHELGHDFTSYRYNFDSEFWTNMLMYYTIEKNNARVYAGYTDYYTGSQLKTFYKSESYMNNPGHPNQAYDFTVGQGIYGHKGLVYNFILIREAIGWEPFEYTFKYFNNMLINEVPATKLGKLNMFLTLLSGYSGVNVFEMFTPQERAIYQAHFGGEIKAVTCTASEFEFLDTSSSFDSFRIIARNVQYSTGATPREVFYWVWAVENGEQTREKYYATKIAGTNNWEATIPRSDHNNALGEYEIACFAVNSPEAEFNRMRTVIKRDAIVIVPGIMGSRLAINGEQVWEPSALTILPLGPNLECSNSGESIKNVSPVNDNAGAKNSYAYLYQQLLSEFGAKYDVIFFPYDWRMDCAQSAAKLEEAVKDYKQIHLVAHSMGGLVSSSYMAQSTENYNKVKTLTTLGTPFVGSAKVLDTFEIGTALGNWADLFLPMKSLSANFVSSYQLIPNARYQPGGFISTEDEYVDPHTNASTFEQVNPQSYIESMQMVKGRDWAIGKNFFFNAAESFHASLLTSGKHITDNPAKVMYVVGTGYLTANSVNIYTLHSLELTATILKHNYEDGDGTVTRYSAQNANQTNNQVKTVMAEHVGILENGQAIGHVINHINGAVTSASSPAAAPAQVAAQEEQKLSVIVYTTDELQITDDAGNFFVRENDILYKVVGDTKIYVATIWASGENYEQYALDPNQTYHFIFQNNEDGVLNSMLGILDFDSNSSLFSERYDMIGSLGDRTITVSLHES